MVDAKFVYFNKVIKDALMLGMLASFLLFSCAMSYAADSQNGERLYAIDCASCHGANGTSVMFGTPNFRQGEGLLQTDREIFASIKGGKNAMPAYQGILSDTEILDVIAYLHTLY